MEILIYAFAVQTQQILRRGIYRTYVEFEDRLPYVRGRVLPLEDARHQWGLRDRITCRFAELTAARFHKVERRRFGPMLNHYFAEK